MSTTLNRDTALFYAKGGADKSKHGQPALVFEAQMGMVDRGADVSWLSEFPHEVEILFAPYVPPRSAPDGALASRATPGVLLLVCAAQTDGHGGARLARRGLGADF